MNFKPLEEVDIFDLSAALEHCLLRTFLHDEKFEDAQIKWALPWIYPKGSRVNIAGIECEIIETYDYDNGISIAAIPILEFRKAYKEATIKESSCLDT